MDKKKMNVKSRAPAGTMLTFLDLDPIEGVGATSDEAAAKVLLDRFQPSIALIGKRKKQLKRIGISYDTPSVALYDQAKDLFCLGYFVSAIIMCRSTAEYLAFEIFFEEFNDIIKPSKN